MKREDVKNKIPGITEEQLNWLMQENGADINRGEVCRHRPADPAEQRECPAQDRAGRPCRL